MVKNAQPQGRVPRRAAGHPSSMRTVAGTLTHVDVTKKMTTGPSPDMAFLDSYLFTQTSDLNTPEIDFKVFNFGKENAKSKQSVTKIESKMVVGSPQPVRENTAFFDMVNSPPSFGDEESTSTLNNTREWPTATLSTKPIERPIPKAPMLNSKPLEFTGVGNNYNVGNNNNPITKPSEMPFEIPNFDDAYLFPESDLRLDTDQLISSLDLDLLVGDELYDNNDILSQAVAESVIPSQEQLNNMLETPGMMPPTFAQQPPSHFAPVELFPAQLAPSLLSHDSLQSNSASQEIVIPVQSNSTSQEIVIPNIFLNSSECQVVTYQVQGLAPSHFQQVQNNVHDNIQHMEVETIAFPEELEYKPEELEYKPEKLEYKPIVMVDESIPSTSTCKRRRTAQKPARYRDTLEYPDEPQPSTSFVDPDEPQPSTSFGGEKKIKLTDEEKYHRIRIMNNVASRKCRQKRKQTNRNTEQEIKELEQKQITLKAREAELIKMRDRMKAIYYEFLKRKMTPR